MLKINNNAQDRVEEGAPLLQPGHLRERHRPRQAQGGRRLQGTYHSGNLM